MFSVSPIATASTALSVPPSVLATPASDQVSTRVTPVALAAPLSNAAVGNDARTPASQPEAAQTQVIARQPDEQTAVTGDSANAGGPSSAFLAQLISQSSADDNEDNQIALASSFSRFAPAPAYTTFVGYSVVKFRPSDAGLPSAYTPAAQAQSQNDNVSPAVVTANDYQAYNTTQSRNKTNLTDDEPQLVVAG